MAKVTTSISEFALADTRTTELQIIADIVSHPETLLEAEKILREDMFEDEQCRAAYNTLRQMSSKGETIDLMAAYSRLGVELTTKGIIPMMAYTGGASTAIGHYATLKAQSLKRACYFEAMKIMSQSCDASVQAQDLINEIGSWSERLRNESQPSDGMQHISQVMVSLGDTLEQRQQEKASGKMLRVPTGFDSLNFYTYGGYNAGNLVILAARPSVGKTAVMLQMAKAAAMAGKSVNILSLEMTNEELVQRFLSAESTELNQWRMARGDIEWKAFELAVGNLSHKPIYLCDSVYTFEEIRANIILNAQCGKCDIAFIDYLGLIQSTGNKPQHLAIAEITTSLKRLAKECRIPIVLLCQLNRASASEKRAPMLYDLRDSGSIEQDADIVLMLERSETSEDGKDVNMWVRKNRQGKAGEVKIEIVANESFSAFTEKGNEAPAPFVHELPSLNTEFDQSEFPF